MKKLLIVLALVCFLFQVASGLTLEIPESSRRLYKPNGDSIMGEGDYNPDWTNTDSNLYPGDTFTMEFDLVNTSIDILNQPGAYMTITVHNDGHYDNDHNEFSYTGFVTPRQYLVPGSELIFIEGVNESKHFSFDFNAILPPTTYPTSIYDNQTDISVYVRSETESLTGGNFRFWFENSNHTAPTQNWNQIGIEPIHDCQEWRESYDYYHLIPLHTGDNPERVCYSNAAGDDLNSNCDDGLSYTDDYCDWSLATNAPETIHTPGTCNSQCFHESNLQCFNEPVEWFDGNGDTNPTTTNNEFHMQLNYANETGEKLRVFGYSVNCEICYFRDRDNSWGDCVDWRLCTDANMYENTPDISITDSWTTEDANIDINLAVKKANSLDFGIYNATAEHSYSWDFLNDSDCTIDNNCVQINPGADLNVDFNIAFIDNGGEYHCGTIVYLVREPYFGESSYELQTSGHKILLGGDGLSGPDCSLHGRFLGIAGDDLVIREINVASYYIKPNQDYNILVTAENMGTTTFDSSNKLFIEVELLDDKYNTFVKKTFETNDSYDLDSNQIELINPGEIKQYELPIYIPPERFKEFLASGLTRVKVYKILEDSSEHIFDQKQLFLPLARLIQIFCPESNFWFDENVSQSWCPQPDEIEGLPIYENECIIDLPPDRTCDYNLMLMNPLPDPKLFDLKIHHGSPTPITKSLTNSQVSIPGFDITSGTYGTNFDNFFSLNTQLAQITEEYAKVSMEYVDDPNVGDDLNVIILLSSVDIGIKEMKLNPKQGVYVVGDNPTIDITVKNFGQEAVTEDITVNVNSPWYSDVYTIVGGLAVDEEFAFSTLPIGPFPSPGDYEVRVEVVAHPMEYRIANNHARIFAIVRTGPFSIDELPLALVLMVMVCIGLLLVKK